MDENDSLRSWLSKKFKYKPVCGVHLQYGPGVELKSMEGNGRLRNWLSKKFKYKVSGNTIFDRRIFKDDEQNPSFGNFRFPLTESRMKSIVRFSHSVFSSPFDYPGILMEVDQSFRYKFINRSFLSIFLLSIILQITGIIVHVFSDHFDMTARSTPFRLMTVFLDLMASIFQINYHLNSDEIQRVWNSVTSIFRRMVSVMLEDVTPEFLEKAEKMKRKYDAICYILMSILIVSVTFLVTFYLGFFLVKCEYHVLSHTLPVCKPNGGHRWDLAMLVFVGFQISCCLQIAIAFLITASVIILAVFGCHLGMAILKAQLEHSSEAGWTHDAKLNWNTCYRCMTLLHQRHHATMGYIVIPSFFLIVMFILVTNNYILLLDEADGFIKCIAGVINVDLFIFLVFVIRFATAFPEQSKDLVHLRKSLNISTTNYFYYYLNSCRPHRVFVGDFFYLDKDLIPQMMQSVLAYTIDVVMI